MIYFVAYILMALVVGLLVRAAVKKMDADGENTEQWNDYYAVGCGLFWPAFIVVLLLLVVKTALTGEMPHGPIR